MLFTEISCRSLRIMSICNTWIMLICSTCMILGTRTYCSFSYNLSIPSFSLGEGYCYQNYFIYVIIKARREKARLV